ncbi:MAG: DUF222 domain-containing protein [Gemmatimonadetes bacterium]|nr:DUF222 domain-containing protein [Gemmatimonadota bacterium]
MVQFAAQIAAGFDEGLYAPPVRDRFRGLRLLRLCESAPVYDVNDEPEASPESDPWSDIDEIEELEEEIVVLSAHLHAGEHRLLVLVAEYDRRRGWELGGHRTCAHWLAFRTGIDLGAAREKVRAARALTELPGTSAAMRRGELSFSMVRALTRVATPENEADLLELACGCTAAQLERIVRGFRLGSRQDEAVREQARHDSREFSVFPDEEGVYVVRGRLTPEIGALLMRAVEAAGDALYRERGFAVMTENGSAEPSRQASAQRRADAIGLVAERALAAGFGGSEVGTEGTLSQTDDALDPEQDLKNGSAEPSRRIPVSGTRAERYQVLLHVDAETLSEEGGLGRSEFEDGTRVSAETSRRIACDASVVPIRHGNGANDLDVGRKTRTISPAQRRALEARDRGCRFPGCGLRFTDAHHVKHWADGGETALGNLVLLCSYHHRLVHEENWKVEWWGAGRPAFIDPRGQKHFNPRRPAPALLPSDEDPVEALIQDTRSRGADPDFYTAGARWKREDDIPREIYFRALEGQG